MKIKDAVYVYRLFDGERLQWHGRYHAHGVSEFEVHIFLEGTGSFLQNTVRYPIQPGAVFLSGAHDFHSILPEAVVKPITYYAFLFSVEDEDQLSQGLYTLLSSVLKKKQPVSCSDANVRFQLEEILVLSKSPEKYLNRAAEYLLASFLYRWYHSYGQKRAEKKQQSDKKNSVIIVRAIQYMEESVNKNIRIKDLAEKLNISAEHFIRLFRHDVHTTPHRYFMRLKISAATGYLTATDKSVKEIAGMLGFDNQFYFSAAFKKCMGLSPSEYRSLYFQKKDLTVHRLV